MNPDKPKSDSRAIVLAIVLVLILLALGGVVVYRSQPPPEPPKVWEDGGRTWGKRGRPDDQ